MNRVPDPLLGTSAAAFIVGDLLVDVGQQRVTRTGVDIALPNLSFRLLLALVRAAPNVLGNDSLMTQVWPGLVVSPETHHRAQLSTTKHTSVPQRPGYFTGSRDGTLTF